MTKKLYLLARELAALAHDAYPEIDAALFGKHIAKALALAIIEEQALVEIYRNDDSPA